MKYEVFLEAAVNLFEINFLEYVWRLEIAPTMMDIAPTVTHTIREGFLSKEKGN